MKLRRPLCLVEFWTIEKSQVEEDTKRDPHRQILPQGTLRFRYFAIQNLQECEMRGNSLCMTAETYGVSPWYYPHARLVEATQVPPNFQNHEVVQAIRKMAEGVPSEFWLHKKVILARANCIENGEEFLFADEENPVVLGA
jgi:hypothetical protein